MHFHQGKLVRNNHSASIRRGDTFYNFFQISHAVLVNFNRELKMIKSSKNDSKVDIFFKLFLNPNFTVYEQGTHFEVLNQANIFASDI